MQTNRLFALTDDEYRALSRFITHLDRLSEIHPVDIEIQAGSDMCPYMPEMDPRGIQRYSCPFCGNEVVSMVKHPRQNDEPLKEEEFAVLAEMSDKTSPMEL